MNPDLTRALRGLGEAAAFAWSYRFELDPEYLSLIERVELLAQNRAGADKSGRWRGSRADREVFLRSARLLSGRP